MALSRGGLATPTRGRAPQVQRLLPTGGAQSTTGRPLGPHNREVPSACGRRWRLRTNQDPDTLFIILSLSRPLYWHRDPRLRRHGRRMLATHDPANYGNAFQKLTTNADLVEC